MAGINKAARTFLLPYFVILSLPLTLVPDCRFYGVRPENAANWFEGLKVCTEWVFFTHQQR
ncbi:hypothetical protein AABM17_2493 [Neisseria musculi]|uniref:Uncharacterized protein n=1 Tax=Neisseria musculi TaxID=1815583 RepID=A0A7H1MA44_9NEIS|nr:hypothetical protein H7A79_2492 [Neisseria musculi]